MREHEAGPEVSFGAWLQQRRKALDLTQDELARRVGCSLSTIRKIESDERRPSRQVAELLAEQLALSPEQRPLFLKVARATLPADRLPPAAPDSAELPPGASRLPALTTPLVGREPELAALAQLLADPGCRLITLTGPGGIGKTRLALEAAARQQDLFADGAAFVPLSALNSPDFLAPAMADALGFALQGPSESRTQLLNFLRPRQALLVLDNLEHLLAAAGLLAEILECAPGVRILATSRERLNLQGEWVFELQGLPVPPSDQPGAAEAYSAVALFVQSAQRARAGFQLRADDNAAVARICQLVEGMPLAIELAAAWVSTLECVEILAEIESSLDFLTTTMRDVPERQRSLRAAFEHSWNLLGAEERRVLSELAIFQGGFSREAAEVVAGASLTSLSVLVSKSLVRRAKRGRYDLHEVVRQYACSYLGQDGGREMVVRDRHCDYYLAMWRDRVKGLMSDAQQETLRELTDELQNAQVAWKWAIEHEKFTALGQAGRCWGWLCDVRGWLHQGIDQGQLLIDVLRSGPQTPERRAVLGQALAYVGLLTFRLGWHDRAQAALEEALALLRPTGDPALLTDPLTVDGIVHYLNGDLARARSLLEEGLARAQEAGDSWAAALSLFNLGYLDSMEGHDTVGYERMHAGLAMWRGLGDPRATALGLNFLSPVAVTTGRLDEAQAYAEESLALTTSLKDRWGMGTAYRNLGLVALGRDDALLAQSLVEQALDLFAELDARWDVARSLNVLGEIAIARGDWLEAGRALVRALRMAAEIGALPLVLDILDDLARVEAWAGETGRAFELAFFVSENPAGTHQAKDQASELLVELEPRLTPPQIAEAQDRVSQIDLDTLRRYEPEPAD